MNTKLNALLIVIFRCMSALIALSVSFLVVVIYGKPEAGSYFIFFSLSYLLAQLYKMGGEIDVLTNPENSIGELVSISVSKMATCVLFSMPVVTVLVIYLTEYSIIALISTAISIAISETIGDFLKRKGRNIFGTVFSGGAIYLVFFILLVFVNFLNLKLNIFDVVLMSSFITIVICICFLCKEFKVRFIGFCSIDNLVESRNSLAFNLLNNLYPPCILYISSYIFTLEFAADLRLTMRIATLLMFSHLAIQQLLLAKVRNHRVKKINFLSFIKKHLALALPISTLCLIVVLIFLFILDSFTSQFNGDFLWYGLIWSFSFYLTVNFSGAQIYYVGNRNFARIFSIRLIAFAIVILLISLCIFNEITNVYVFVFVCASFYVLQALLYYVLRIKNHG